MDDTTTASGQALLSAIRTFVIAVGMGLAGYGFMSQNSALTAGAVVPPILAGAWGVYSSWQKWHAQRAAVIKAVQATTANLTGDTPTIPQAITTIASVPFRNIVRDLPPVPKKVAS